MLDVVLPRLRLDLAGKPLNLALGDVTVRIQCPQPCPEFERVQPVARRQVTRHGEHVHRVGRQLEGDRGVDLAQDPRSRGIIDRQRPARRSRLLDCRSCQHERGRIEGPARDPMLPPLDHQWRHINPSQHQPCSPQLRICPHQRRDLLTVGLAQLAFEHAEVVFRQVDPRFVRISGNLPQAAGCRLEDEVVGSFEFSGQRARKQARAVPPLRALVDEENHPLRLRRIVQVIERFLVSRMGQLRVRRVDEHQGGALSKPRQRRFDDRFHFGEVVSLRKVDRQPGRCAVGQPDIIVALEKVLDDLSDQLRRVVPELIRDNAVRDVLEDALANAL